MEKTVLSRRAAAKISMRLAPASAALRIRLPKTWLSKFRSLVSSNCDSLRQLIRNAGAIPDHSIAVFEKSRQVYFFSLTVMA